MLKHVYNFIFKISKHIHDFVFEILKYIRDFVFKTLKYVRDFVFKILKHVRDFVKCNIIKKYIKNAVVICYNNHLNNRSQWPYSSQSYHNI